MSSLHRETTDKEHSRAVHRLRRAGYKADGGRTVSATDDESDKRLLRKGIHQHDAQLHPGKHTKLKLRKGGKIDGPRAEHGAHRRARGGGIPKLGHKGGNINIVLHGGAGEKQAAHQQGTQEGMAQGMRLGAAMGARRAAQQMQRPPMGGPPPGGPPQGRLPIAPPGGGGPSGGGMPPPGGPPGMAPRPPGMFAKGGVVKVREHTRRARGGRTCKQMGGALEMQPGLGRMPNVPDPRGGVLQARGVPMAMHAGLRKTGGRLTDVAHKGGAHVQPKEVAETQASKEIA